MHESQVQIGSGKEGWTLGAALAEGSKVMSAPPSSFIQAGYMPGEVAVLAHSVMNMQQSTKQIFVVLEHISVAAGEALHLLCPDSTSRDGRNLETLDVFTSWFNEMQLIITHDADTIVTCTQLQFSLIA